MCFVSVSSRAVNYKLKSVKMSPEKDEIIISSQKI